LAKVVKKALKMVTKFSINLLKMWLKNYYLVQLPTVLDSYPILLYLKLNNYVVSEKLICDTEFEPAKV
jgi:hypothetical protein